MTEDEFFEGHPFARQAYDRVRELLDELGPYEIRIGTSQISFRRARGFAYVWIPGRHLTNPDADVVLSVALDRQLGSPRFKEVVHPSARTWMHHLEIHRRADIDDEVRDWLAEAATGAAHSGRAGRRSSR
jgi:hypothetical protein